MSLAALVQPALVPSDWPAFSRAAHRALWGPLLPLLRNLGVGWNDGGCRILAEAYLLWLPGAARYVLVGSHGATVPKVQHVVARVGDHYLDGDGASTAAEMLERWRSQEDVLRPSLVPDPDARLADEETEIPYDSELSRRLAVELQRRLGKRLDLRGRGSRGGRRGKADRPRKGANEVSPGRDRRDREALKTKSGGPATLLTREKINAAPMWTIFNGPARAPGPMMWAVFDISDNYSQAMVARMEKLDVHPSEPELDSEFESEQPQGADDISAGLAYLSSGGTLCKVPDTEASKSWRLLVVGTEVRPVTPITRERIAAAPMWTIFQGRAMDPGPVMWIVSEVNFPPSDAVVEKMKTVDAYSSSPELDGDEEQPRRDVDDIDAALAYLNTGGVLCKVPRTPRSKAWRLLVVGEVSKYTNDRKRYSVITGFATTKTSDGHAALGRHVGVDYTGRGKTERGAMADLKRQIEVADPRVKITLKREPR
jgi:hypothetical protein